VTTAGNSQAVFQIGANENDTLGVNFGTLESRPSVTSARQSRPSPMPPTPVRIAAAAGALITSTDGAIGVVSSMNSNFGAVENRLDDTVATLSVTSENLNASESRIKDLDVAAEMVNFTKTQILQQAGTAILAQANSAPQNILTCSLVRLEARPGRATD